MLEGGISAVEDLDALVEKLEEAGGVDFGSEPHTMRSGTRLCFVKEPDGYRVDVNECNRRILLQDVRIG